MLSKPKLVDCPVCFGETDGQIMVSTFEVLPEERVYIDDETDSPIWVQCPVCGGRGQISQFAITAYTLITPNGSIPNYKELVAFGNSVRANEIKK